MTHSRPRPGHAAQSPYKRQYARSILVLKAIGGGIWDYDLATGRLECNRRWHEIVGLDYRTQLIASIAQFQTHIHPDDVAMATRVDLVELARLVAEQERYIAEFRIIRPDGDIRRIRSVACLVGNAQSLRAVGCITDVTQSDEPYGPADAVSRPQAPAEPAPTQIHALSHAAVLSDHERECLWWVSYGKTAWETAAILNRSQRTVEYHLANAIRKLDASNKVHAAVLAIRRNLL